MSIRATCPYCNAVVALPAVPAGKTPCPRCDQAFAVADYETVADEPAPTPAPRPVASPRRAWLVSGVLSLVAAAVGVSVVVLRQPPPPPSATPARPPGTTPPPALAGLTLLPATANVLFAVQPGPLTDADLAALGLPAPVLAGLRDGGISLSQIDHLAGGLTVGSDNLIPGLAVVLKLRSPPADEERFLRAVKAEKRAKAGRPTYSVALGLPLTLVRVDDTTYLFGLTDADVAGVPGPVPLKDVLATLSPASYAWLATADEAWADKPLVKAATKTAQADQAAKLKGLRRAVVGVSTEPGPRLRVTITATDAAAAAAFRDELRPRFPAVGGADRVVEIDAAFDPTAGFDVRKLVGGQ